MGTMWRLLGIKMKASKLIKELKLAIDKHGDQDVVRDDYGYYNIEAVEFVPGFKNRRVSPYDLQEDVFNLI